ncbi:hypothetical protein KVR01_005173 [Diaporthe batatas]|uniref:uncharacterized protein n=1 Tax=Diaporthe batatas TaxID=748121 RepID=UPI001D0449F2|nr:uncharacterized protein KVR01_005173 [Diaporthe batatas]KAG8164898.1 hypothetical protein KVR01_005173 [Diaporthe batatas]
MLVGRPPNHPFWKLMQMHLSRLLAQISTSCEFSIKPSTIYYYEGCWVEKHIIQGWHGADGYLMVLLAGTLLLRSGWPDNRVLLSEISTVMAQITGIVALPNDLFAFYKQFDQVQLNLMSNLSVFEDITMEQTLKRLTDKDAAVLQPIR